MSLERLDRAWLEPLIQKARERFYERVPVFGWILWTSRFRRLCQPVVDRIEAILQERPPTPAHAWGDDAEIQRIGSIVSRKAVEQIWWSNDHFIPEDDFALAFWAWQDGLDDVEAMMELEDELGVTITDDDLCAAQNWTLEAFVGWLAVRSRKNLDA